MKQTPLKRKTPLKQKSGFKKRGSCFKKCRPRKPFLPVPERIALPKNRRIVDLVAIEEARRPHCQIPGCYSTWNKQVHHIKSRGSGGPDEPWNMIDLCCVHHDAAQQYKIPQRDLFLIKRRDLFDRGEWRPEWDHKIESCSR
jgi:hypothetical protein